MVIIYFFYDEHFWCQVWRTLLLYFQRYSLFSILHFELHNLWRHHFPNLHNRKMPISLKQKKIFQKGKCHSYFFWKACQINCNYFSFHRHFKTSFWHSWCAPSLNITGSPLCVHDLPLSRITLEVAIYYQWCKLKKSMRNHHWQLHTVAKNTAFFPGYQAGRWKTLGTR